MNRPRTEPGSPRRRARTPGAPAPRLTRRGVASVLAMMFVVMFGSLAVAMAVASQGNLRTANTHLHVLRAMGAADTGLAIAQQRLQEAVARFVVEKGGVDSDFGDRLWNGDYGAGDGDVTVLAARNGRADVFQTRGIADALINAHYADANVVALAGLPRNPESFAPSGGTDFSVYKADAWVRTPLLAIDADASEVGARAASYQITYAPLANGTDVRIIVTGYSSVGAGGSDYGYRSGSADVARPVTRTVYQDFRIAKRPQHAILSPSRIMIGKNVQVEGDMGARYADVQQNNGHPMKIKSDFQGLAARLDAKLEAFFEALAASDVDGDNRLRVGHAVEGAGIPPASEDFDGDGQGDGAFADVTNDGYVDEFDVFIKHYDANGDGRVALSAALTAGTPNAAAAPEFTADEDMAILLDSALPDRNRNGQSGFVDADRNGRWDSGETMSDRDPRTGRNRDQVLGWRDGVIDRKDQYAKVRGKLMFKVDAQEWASAQGGSFGEQLRGPIRPDAGKIPTEFGLSDDDLPDVGPDSFTDSQTPLKSAADGASFEQQVATQLGVSTADLATYVEAETDATQPRYWRADLDDAYVVARTGRHLWEKMPFNAPSYSDFYYRPRYENMTFKNVQIPMGNNGLFVNCTFVGVTYVRSYTANTHTNWTLYGKMVWNAVAASPAAATDPLDKSDFLRYTTGLVADGPANYSAFPDPPVINGQIKTGAARDTKKYSNNIRFHDCLFVGSIVGDTPTEYTHVRNKTQFTGGTRFTTAHPDEPANPDLNPDADELEEIAKSSMMLPNYSVDIGSFNSPTDTYTGAGAPPGQNVQLKGTIVAGVLDVRGNTRIEGGLLLTFEPIAGQGPLQQNGAAVGNPAGFNTTIGYFGPDDGDGESLDPETLPIVGGQRIVGWDTDGDGISDLAASQPQPAGATAVPFYGYGRVELIWNPDLPMPDGVMLPISVSPLKLTYREGRP